MVDFIFIIIELFSLAFTDETFYAKSVKVSVFKRGWVTFSADFRGKGHRPPTNVGVRKL